MARTLEAYAPNSLSAFTIKVIVAGAVTETITMAHVALEPGTWRGTIAQAGSVGPAKLSFYWNGSTTEADVLESDISATDGTTSYARPAVGLSSGTIAAIWAALTSGLTTVGSIGKLIVDVLSGLAGGSTGARTVTITVNDGATALQNATVRLSQGAQSYVGATNVNGVVVFSVDDATWTVSITKPGYSFTPTTIVVNGDETATYSMSLVAITAPADPAFCTLAIRRWGTNGVVAVGVDVKAQVITPPTGTGEMFNDSIMTDATGGDGYATFTIPKSCGVRYWIGSREKKIDNVGTDSVVYVDNWLGHE